MSSKVAARSSVGFKPRDRVVWIRLGKNFYGTIVKVHKITALVRLDGHIVGPGADELVDLDELRRETSEDATRRLHEEQLQEWRSHRPATPRVRLTPPSAWNRDWGDHDPIGAETDAKTPDDMRAAARELLALADWFEAKPRGTACQHQETRRGKDIPLRWGSWRSEVCQSCRMYRARAHYGGLITGSHGRWRPADQYEADTSRTDGDQ